MAGGGGWCWGRQSQGGRRYQVPMCLEIVEHNLGHKHFFLDSEVLRQAGFINGIEIHMICNTYLKQKRRTITISLPYCTIIFFLNIDFIILDKMFKKCILLTSSVLNTVNILWQNLICMNLWQKFWENSWDNLK